MTNLDSIVKIRDIILLGPSSQSYGFPVVMCGCESWTIKKVEHRRTDAFESWCWRRLLRVPRTARRSNQSILKEISPEYSLEGLMLKLQYFGQLMKELTHWKRPWCWKRLNAGEGDERGWDGWMGSPTWCTSLSKLREALLSLWHGANQLTSLDFWFLFCIMRGLENTIKTPFHSRSCFTFRSTKPTSAYL